MSGEGTTEQVLAGEARWAVVHGDCLDVLPTLPDACVDHVITDPPYSQETSENARTDAGGRLPHAWISFAGIDADCIVELTNQFLRVARRWALAFCAAEQLGIYRAEAGKQWIRSGAWVKPSYAPQFTGDRPAMGFEACAIMHRSGKKRWNGGGRSALWTHLPERDRGSGHPTPKPVPLMLELLDLFTDPNDVVLDAFGGSGTTGVAAARLGRRVILIEREQRWADLCRERLRAEEQGISLSAARAGQEALFR